MALELAPVTAQLAYVAARCTCVHAHLGSARQRAQWKAFFCAVVVGVWASAQVPNQHYLPFLLLTPCNLQAGA